MKLVTITTNIAHLGAQPFAAVEFPLPLIAEHHRIVVEVDRRLSVLDANLARCDRLRQAVLERAFEGRPVQTVTADDAHNCLSGALSPRPEASERSLP